MSGSGDSVLIYLVDRDDKRRARTTEKLYESMPSAQIESFANASDAWGALVAIRDPDRLPRAIVVGDQKKQESSGRINTVTADIFTLKEDALRRAEQLGADMIPVFGYVRNTTDTYEIERLGVKTFKANPPGRSMSRIQDDMCAEIKRTLFPRSTAVDEEKGKGRKR